MRDRFIASIMAASLFGFALASSAAARAEDAPAPGHHREELRAALFDAHLEGLKAGLKLSAEQEKNWAPFESALRDAAKQRVERIRAWRERDDADEKPSLIDHLRKLSDRLAQRSAEVKTIADAAAPLYASLDDGQKRIFGALFREIAHSGRHGGHHRRD